jgi:choline-sulfatase
VIAARRVVMALALAGAAVACRGHEEGKKQRGPDASIVPVTDAALAEAVDAALAAKPPPQQPPKPPNSVERVERVVWRAIDNRAMVHRTVGDDVAIDAGGYGFGRFTRYGIPAPRWQLAQQVDGEPAAIAAPLAAMELPLTEQQARATIVTMRLHADEATQISIKINGRKPRKKPIDLLAGWQNVAQELPRGWLAPGANQVVLEHGKPGRRRAKGTTKANVALAWVRAGTSRDFTTPLPAARFVEAARRLELAAGSAVAWYVTLPEGGHLRAVVAAPCHVEVRATTSDGGFVGGRMVGGEAQSRVDLSSFAGRVVRLELRAVSPEPDGPAGAGGAADAARRCEVAQIDEPEITLHGPEVAPPPPGVPPRLVILWVLDATRADRIPIFTPGASVQTPNLEELARTSAVFRQYYVQGNESQTSHSTVWSGVYPAIHNVRLAGSGGSSRIPRKLPVIAELLTAADYFTTAVTGNGFVNESGGYTRGFREFRNMMREKGVINGVLYGEDIVSAALGRLQAHREEPTFLFLGTVDSHSPWIGRQPWLDRYSPAPYDGPFETYGDGFALGFRKGSMGCSKIPPPKDIARLRAIYDSTISYSDDLLGKLISQLKIWNVWDETMLILTADHGDELFEHRRCGHGGSLRDTLVRVPLLVHYPAQFPAAAIDEGAEGVDIVPTILDAVGAPPLPGAQGRSLRALVAGDGRGWTSPSYASQYEYAHAMRLGRWKIAVSIRGEVSVFDMQADPYEDQERAAAAPVEHRMLADHLGLFLATRARWQKASWGVVSSITAEGARQLDGPVPGGSGAP